MARFSDEAYLKEWRMRQVAISQHAVMAHLYATVSKQAEEKEMKERFQEKSDKACKDLVEEIFLSAKRDDNPLKLQYLRNFTSAFYLATARGQQNEEIEKAFDKEFRYPTWVGTDDMLAQLLGKDAYFEQVAEAQEMCRYIELTVHLYTNRLLNLAQDRGLEAAFDESAINQLKDLHQQFEEQKMFDEIAVIRYQLIQQILADTPDILFDEAAHRVFTIDAYDMLNEINTKARQLEPVGGPRG